MHVLNMFATYFPHGGIVWPFWAAFHQILVARFRPTKVNIKRCQDGKLKFGEPSQNLAL